MDRTPHLLRELGDAGADCQQRVKKGCSERAYWSRKDAPNAPLDEREPAV